MSSWRKGQAGEEAWKCLSHTGVGLVHEPEPRQQAYVVGNRTVIRDELLSVLYMFHYILAEILKTYPKDTKAVMFREIVSGVVNTVQYANNIYDWDWLEGIGESYVYEHDIPGDSRGDKFLFPKRWGGGQLPPCPLLLL